MKREAKSILDYLKAIAWVVVPFCLLGSLHYLFFFFPRAVCEKDNHILFNHLGFDYFGVIVGFFTLFITFLVGWQIYSTINARKEISDFKDKTERDFQKRIEHLEKCCEEGHSNIKKLHRDIATYSVLQERVMQIMESEFAELYLTQLTPANQISRIEFHYLNHRIQSIIRASNLGDIPGCNIQTRATIESIGSVKEIRLSKTMRRLLIDGILSVKNPNLITDFDKLSRLINNISEK